MNGIHNSHIDIIKSANKIQNNGKILFFFLAQRKIFTDRSLTFTDKGNKGFEIRILTSNDYFSVDDAE